MWYVANVFNSILINTNVHLPFLPLLNVSPGHQAKVLFSKSNSMGALTGPVPSTHHHLKQPSCPLKPDTKLWLVKYLPTGRIISNIWKLSIDKTNICAKSSSTRSRGPYNLEEISKTNKRQLLSQLILAYITPFSTRTKDRSEKYTNRTDLKFKTDLDLYEIETPCPTPSPTCRMDRWGSWKMDLI